MIKFGIQMELTIPIPTTRIIKVQMNIVVIVIIVVTYIPSTSMPGMKLDNSKDVFTFPWLLPSRYSFCLR